MTLTELYLIRDGRETDHAFICATWKHGLNFNGVHEPDWDAINKYVDSALEDFGVQTLVAALVDEPNVILGYCVYQERKLLWVYVKKAWRELGIATKLVPKDIKECAFVTAVGRKLMPRDWKHTGPFAEDLNGEV